MTANFSGLLPLLVRRGVHFIVIGGGAAIAHGIARLTYDVDVVYSRDPENSSPQRPLPIRHVGAPDSVETRRWAS